MTAAERKIATGDVPGAKVVRARWRLLQDLGKDLSRRGVHFVDLTQVFSGTSAIIYKDVCCHVNDLGNDIIATAVSKAVAAGLRRN